MRTNKRCISDTFPDADTASEIVQPPNEEAVYSISGKISLHQHSSLNVVVTTSIYVFQSIRKTYQSANLSFICLAKLEQRRIVGNRLQSECTSETVPVKRPFQSFSIALTHPSNGRYHNALTKAKKNSTIHATGILFSIKNNFYCESWNFNSLRQNRKQILVLSCLGS